MSPYNEGANLCSNVDSVQVHWEFWWIVLELKDVISHQVSGVNSSAVEEHIEMLVPGSVTAYPIVENR